MPVQAAVKPIQKRKPMGEVRVTVTLTNASDEVLQRQHKLSGRRMRKYRAEALVDRGAVRTVIPTEVVKRLGGGDSRATRSRVCRWPKGKRWYYRAAAR